LEYSTPSLIYSVARSREYRVTRNQLLIDGGLDFKRLLTEKEGVSKLARWWIRSGRLNQFRLANELIK
jgi:hypothetical protein